MNNNLTAPLNKIIKFSNVDGPGNRMAIFFQKCNFNCKYCHNPETINICGKCGACVEACPTGALKKVNEELFWDLKKCVDCDECIKKCSRNSSPKVKDVTVEDLMKEIKKVKPFIKGITVSGGESTLQYEFLTELFKEVKNQWPDLTCFVDTNGSLDFQDERVTEFLKITDYFMLDVKAWYKEEHLDLIGKDNKIVISNLKYLIEIGKLYEVRTVVVPELLSNEAIIENVSKIIGDKDIRYKLIKYRAIGVRDNLKKGMFTPTQEYMEKLEKIAQDNKVKSTLII